MKTMPSISLLSIGLLALLGDTPAVAQNAPAAMPAAQAMPAGTTAPPVATPSDTAPAVAVMPVAPAMAPEPAPACELHVFPTLEGMAITTGWGVGFGLIGAVMEASANKDRNVRDAAYLKEALGPRLQIEALKTVDLAHELKLPPSQVIFETPIADRNVTTKAETRLASSPAECYAELIVTQNFYHKAAIYGRSLNNRFVFKDFRTGKSKANLIKGRGGNGLSHFPPAKTDETEAAELELKTTFAKNFLEFAKGFNTKS